MPVLSTQTMPVRAARFGTRGLPPLGLGGSGGSSGSTISPSSSGTNSFAMSRSVASDHAAWNDPKSFANIGIKSDGWQRFTALLHQLPLWC